MDDGKPVWPQTGRTRLLGESVNISRLISMVTSLFVIFSAAAQFSANAQADDSNLDRPQARQVRGIRGVVYAIENGVDLTCDVYTPADLSIEKPIPAVLLIHGGAWSSGDKMAMTSYAYQLAQLGAVTISINYRHAPEYKFPAQLDDVREALIWINDHAKEYSIDTNRIGIFGYSAGGHLACMMATLVDEPRERVLKTSSWQANDPRWQRLPKIAAVVAGGPPCEFRDLPINNTGLVFFLGGTRGEIPDVYDAASPISFASSGDCPICFIHGERDFIVPLRSSRSLYNAQVAVGVKSQFVVVEKQGHLVTFLHAKTSETLSNYMKQTLGLE